MILFSLYMGAIIGVLGLLQGSWDLVARVLNRVPKGSIRDLWGFKVP